MSTFPGPFNPIVYAQFNLQGRWRRLVAVTLIYTLVLGGIIWLSSIDENQSRQIRALKGWVTGLFVLQGLNLTLFGAFRVESAVRLDVTSRMIESHRLMPCSTLANLIGYLVGAPLQSLMIGAANFLLGSVCCQFANLSLNTWAIACIFQLFFSLMCYCVIIQHALVGRGAYIAVILLSFFSLPSPTGSVLALSGSLSALLDSMYGRDALIFQLQGFGHASSDVWTGDLWSIAGQIAVAAIFLRIAVRRFRGSNGVGLSAPLGLALLATWVGLEIVYLHRPSAFSGYRNYSPPSNDEQQIPAVIITTLLLCLLPLAAAAKTRAIAIRNGLNPSSRQGITVPTTALLASVIMIVLGACLIPRSPVTVTAEMLIATALVIASFLLGNASLFSWGYRVMKAGWVYVLLWLLATWVSPLIINAVQGEMSTHPYRSSGAEVFSPLGTLNQIWSRLTPSIWPAVMVQAGSACIPLALALFGKPGKKMQITP